jgi:hypothetical protein
LSGEEKKTSAKTSVCSPMKKNWRRNLSLLFHFPSLLRAMDTTAAALDADAGDCGCGMMASFVNTEPLLSSVPAKACVTFNARNTIQSIRNAACYFNNSNDYGEHSCHKEPTTTAFSSSSSSSSSSNPNLVAFTNGVLDTLKVKFYPHGETAMEGTDKRPCMFIDYAFDPAVCDMSLSELEERAKSLGLSDAASAPMTMGRGMTKGSTRLCTISGKPPCEDCRAGLCCRVALCRECGFGHGCFNNPSCPNSKMVSIKQSGLSPSSLQLVPRPNGDDDDDDDLPDLPSPSADQNSGGPFY